MLRGLGRADAAPSASSELLVWWPQVLDSWPSQLRAKVRFLFLLVLRSIWMERNNRTFKHVSRPEALLLDAIMDEAESGNL